MTQHDIRAAFLLALRLIEQRGPVFESRDTDELRFATIERFKIYDAMIGSRAKETNNG